MPFLSWKTLWYLDHKNSKLYKVLFNTELRVGLSKISKVLESVCHLRLLLNKMRYLV